MYICLWKIDQSNRNFYNTLFIMAYVCPYMQDRLCRYATNMFTSDVFMSICNIIMLTYDLFMSTCNMIMLTLVLHVDMQHIYVNIRLLYVEMQHDYVNISSSCRHATYLC